MRSALDARMRLNAKRQFARPIRIKRDRVVRTDELAMANTCHLSAVTQARIDNNPENKR